GGRVSDHPLPSVEGAITADEVLATAKHIASLQLPDGMIPWYPDGHCDPWNHVETAMALDVAGMHEPARRAYRWLADMQRADGSWHAYYLADGIEDAKLDTNVCAYIAAGVWHHWLVTGDRAFVESMWPTVERAVDWVLALQTPRGEIIWARHVDGTPWSYALLTGSSSICHSLRCAVALAELLGDERPEWELAAVNLADVIRNQPQAFAPKHRWAMDWYYPVLGGALTDAEAAARLESRWGTFVMPGLGVRCVSNEPWVTAAETAECSIAHSAVGLLDTAAMLLRWTRPHRCDDGAYITGLVHPDRVTFPTGERSAYTGAAIILAADAISGASPASGLFLGQHLPAVIDSGLPLDDPELDLD
ncbi:MAG TPA: hypothetical protein VF855_14560, partial [Acidimicrobiales bacterium]